jgi:hypothetical protein
MRIICRPSAAWMIAASCICLSFMTMSMTGCKSSSDSTTDDAAATGEATDSVLDDAGRAIDEAADSATKEMENSFAAAKDKVDEATQTAAEKLGEATETAATALDDIKDTFTDELEVFSKEVTSPPTGDDGDPGGPNVVTLGDPQLTSGIPGEGDLTMEQIQTWLDDPANHELLLFNLPLRVPA